MNIALRKAMTVNDYLARASAQSEGPRTELINGQVVAMSPEQLAHTRVKGAVYFALRRAIADTGIEAEVLTDGATVPIDSHTAYEPDASVRLGPPLPGRDMKVADPVIVVEVISPSSVHTDTSAKLIGYFKLGSVCHYLVIDPETKSVTHHARVSGEETSSRTLSAGTLRLDPPGVAINIADLFS